MTRDEFIERWGYQQEKFKDPNTPIDKLLQEIHQEFINDLDELIVDAYKNGQISVLERYRMIH